MGKKRENWCGHRNVLEQEVSDGRGEITAQCVRMDFTW